ncbi:MAG: L-threonylcarbamoyladenylate synthase [Chloroflexi bacterium]|nr:L-threonylcarbamoyladenylate synthase [Chloroflexota bacterium]
MTRGPAPARRTEVRPGDDPAAIAAAAAIIRAGGLVAFPTETVYGLGANALDPLAVARVFEAKGRPRFDPLIVHLADPGELGRWADAGDVADGRVGRLVAAFWPGPLTLVLRKRPAIPGIVTAGLPTVGLRSPDHAVARALIAASGVPIAAPSANRFGRLSPTRAAHVVRQLGGRIDLVLDGGAARIGVESTVVLLADGRAALLRPGGVAAEAIEALIGPLEHIDDADEGESALAPGRAGGHYAPGPPLAIVSPGHRIDATPDGVRIGLLAASDAGWARAEAVAAGTGLGFAAVEVLAPDGDPVLAAARLFDALHALDEAGLDRIVAQPVPEAGLGRAVMDRLRRAAMDRVTR